MNPHHIASIIFRRASGQEVCDFLSSRNRAASSSKTRVCVFDGDSLDISLRSSERQVESNVGRVNGYADLEFGFMIPGDRSAFLCHTTFYFGTEFSIIEFASFSRQRLPQLRRSGLIGRLLCDLELRFGCLCAVDELPYGNFFLTDDSNVYDERTGEWTFDVDMLALSISPAQVRFSTSEVCVGVK